MRNFCPMNYHTWESVPEDAKNLDGKFELLRTNTIFMEYVHARLHAQWKRTRGKWSEHWKKNGGKTNSQLARSKRKFDCPIQEWNHLCDYWELEKTKENIIEHKEATLDELNSKGITITTTMEHQLEKEAIKSVCARKKTIQSAWEVGGGPVLRKKDSWMK
ncbi:hypothetical protein Hanom_Chr00s000075g01618971 [Helianthus anomalus]